MRFILRYFLLIAFTQNCFSQTGQWVWMKGDNTGNQPGNYGTIGVPASTNKPGGRYEAAQWTDLLGNFWLYGGGSGVVRYSDLWKYDPANNEWTWMHGSQSMNLPPVYG